MKDAGPKPRREDVGPAAADPSPPSVDGARKKVLVAVAIAFAALAPIAALWAAGRDSAGDDFAVAGVRAAAARVDSTALAPSAEAAAPPLDAGAIDGGDSDEEEAADDDDGDAFADWLAEAEARAELAAAAHPPDATDSPPPAESANALAAGDAGPEPAEPQQQLGNATRLRNVGLQLVAICASGHAADVQPLALELLAERPPPWLAKRIRDACLR